MFNGFLRNSMCTKNSFVTPIHNGGSRRESKNYRPVSLTSHIIKVFERVLVCKIVDYLETKGSLNDNQHGFGRKRSCLSQLLIHHQALIDTLENRKIADVVYLDFAKAFDKVDHGVLMSKICEMGLGGTLLRWIYQFFFSRTPHVVI